MKFKRIIKSNFNADNGNQIFTISLDAKEIIKNIKFTGIMSSTVATKDVTQLVENFTIQCGNNINSNFMGQGDLDGGNIGYLYGCLTCFKDAYFDTYLKNNNSRQTINITVSVSLDGAEGSDSGLTVVNTAWFYIWEL